MSRRHSLTDKNGGGDGMPVTTQTDQSRPIEVARPEITFVEKTHRMILDEKIISEIPV